MKTKNKLVAHLLLAGLGSPERKSSLTPPEGFAYNALQGLWINADGAPLVRDEQFVAVGTKKFDIETGEDYKGK